MSMPPPPGHDVVAPRSQAASVDRDRAMDVRPPAQDELDRESRGGIDALVATLVGLFIVLALAQSKISLARLAIGFGALVLLTVCFCAVLLVLGRSNTDAGVLQLDIAARRIAILEEILTSPSRRDDPIRGRALEALIQEGRPAQATPERTWFGPTRATRKRTPPEPAHRDPVLPGSPESSV